MPLVSERLLSHTSVAPCQSMHAMQQLQPTSVCTSSCQASCSGRQAAPPPLHCRQRSTRSFCTKQAAHPSTPCQRRTAVMVLAREKSGPSGINVGGQRPTSPAGWELMKQALRDANVKLIAPQEVAFAQERGTVLVDVRPGADYDAGHVPGAVSVPIYQPITGWSAFKVARRAGYALFGVLNGTEVNENFLEDLEEAVGAKDRNIILYCAQGGSLDGIEGSKKGWQTRSLVAAHEVVADGSFTGSISVLRGGFTEWAKGGRDVEIIEVIEQDQAAEPFDGGEGAAS